MDSYQEPERYSPSYDEQDAFWDWARELAPDVEIDEDDDAEALVGEECHRCHDGIAWQHDGLCNRCAAIEAKHYRDRSKS